MMRLACKRFVVVSSSFSLFLGIFAKAEVVRFDPWDGLIEQDARLQVVQGLCNSLKLNYAGWELKKHIQVSEGYSLGTPAKDGVVADGDQVCADAIAAERKVSDPSNKSRLNIARANLSFRDRVQRLGASFRDSHLMLMPVTRRTPIRLGVDVREIGGKFYVRSVSARVQSYLAMSHQPVPTRGVEVISLGGDALAKARSELLPYLSASTERFSLQSATQALTARSFHYPTSGQTELKWKDSTGVEHKAMLPWLYGVESFAGMPAQQDDRDYLNDIGAIELNDTIFREDPVTGYPMLILGEGVDEDETELALDGNLESTQTLYDVSGEVLARAGTYKEKMILIQIRNFMDWRVAQVKPALQLEKPLPASAMNLDYFLKVWLNIAAQASLPVILDLRNNPGGSAAVARSLIGNVLAAGEKGLPVTEAVPITFHNRFAILQSFNPGVNPLKNSKKSSYEAGFADSFTARLAAESAQRPFMSPLYRGRMIESEGVLKAAPRLIVWAGSNCVSACEVAVMMLAQLKNTTVIGSALNGTGMGQVTTSLESGMVSASEPTGLFTSSLLPNFYFGAPNGAGMDDKGLDSEAVIDARVKRVSENRPLKPAVAYEEQLIDLQKNGLGWLEATEKALAPPATAPAFGGFLTLPGNH